MALAIYEGIQLGNIKIMNSAVKELL